MIDHRYSITSDLSDEVELLLAKFERDRSGGPIEFADYLPPTSDPAYASVVTELARIDLERRFGEGDPLDATRYIRLFPEVFDDLHQRTQLAFEEYRLLRRGGEDVSAQIVGEKYQVDGSHWPQMKLGGDQAESVSRRFTQHELVVPSVHYPKVGKSFAGYPLLSRIGEGAFSRVFLAHQPDLAGRLVVLKVTPLSMDESDRLASLQHTSIVPIYSVHREGELSCICMPFLGATTLADLSTFGERWASLDGPAEELVSTILDRRHSTIREFTPSSAAIDKNESEISRRDIDSDARKMQAGDTLLSGYSNLGYVDALLRLVIGTVEGLTHAHARGIIHRDLKPANILVADDGNPVLLDFNLAVSSEESKKQIVGGTLPYMSPQQLESLQTGAPADARDDVFSVGVILYELLSGVLPFATPKSGQSFELAEVIADRRRTPKSIRVLNPRVSNGLAAIIDRCMEQERSERYRDAGELLEDLNRHRQHLPLKFAPDRSVRERLTKWSARHPRLSSASSVAALATAIVLLCVVLIWQRGERISRLQAASRFQQFQLDLPAAVTALSTPGREQELLSDGLAKSENLMQQWGIKPEQASHLNEASRLDEASRLALRRQLGRLAYLMADAEIDLALQSKDQRQEDLNSNAQRWNDLAPQLDPELRQLAGFQQQQLNNTVEGPPNATAAIPVDENADLDLRSMSAAESGDAGLWRTLIQQQLDRQPTNVAHWFRLAIANSRLGDIDAAAANFDIANRLQPNSIAILLNRGICHLDRGVPTLAHRDFSDCLRLNANLIVPRFNRAIASHRLGDQQSAIDDLTYLVEKGFVTTRILLMRADVNFALGDALAAQADRLAAMDVPPRDANDWVARGVARLADEPEQALADFQSALRIRPADVNAINNAAHVYAEHLGKPESAIELLNRLIEIRPQMASAVASRGILRARTGQTDPALADAAAAIALSPDAREQLQISGIFAIASDKLDDDKMRADAISWLARALRSDISLASIARNDPDLTSLRSEPQFKAVVGSGMVIDSQSRTESLNP